MKSAKLLDRLPECPDALHVKRLAATVEGRAELRRLVAKCELRGLLTRDRYREPRKAVA